MNDPDNKKPLQEQLAVYPADFQPGNLPWDANKTQTENLIYITEMAWNKGHYGHVAKKTPENFVEILKKIHPEIFADLGPRRVEGPLLQVSMMAFDCLPKEDVQQLIPYAANLIAYLMGFKAPGRVITTICASFGIKSPNVKHGSLLAAVFMWSKNKGNAIDLSVLTKPCAKCGNIHAA